MAVAITTAAVVWTSIAAAMSTQRAVSIQTLIWVACCAIFFLSGLALLQRRSVHWLLIPLIPAVVNAVVALLQQLQIWNPFVFPPNIALRAHTTGLLGNPDDVGALLVIPAIAAAALIIDHRGPVRLLYGALAGIIAAGLLATETLSSLIATGAAIVVLLFRLPRRAVLGILLAAALCLAGIFAFHLPIAKRASEAVGQLAAGDIHGAISFRTQPHLTAWRMFADHPLFGVGPGCFGFWYVPYWVSLFPSHPEFMDVPEHFAEAHNDHLQLLATTGLPGYLIFCAAFWYVASTRRTSGSDGRARFVRTFAWPAATAAGVVTLGLFPLELAGPASVMLYFAAAVAAWGSRS
jgi:O-antigen ligase